MQLSLDTSIELLLYILLDILQASIIFIYMFFIKFYNIELN